MGLSLCIKNQRVSCIKRTYLYLLFMGNTHNNLPRRNAYFVVSNPSNISPIHLSIYHHVHRYPHGHLGPVPAQRHLRSLLPGHGEVHHQLRREGDVPIRSGRVHHNDGHHVVRQPCVDHYSASCLDGFCQCHYHHGAVYDTHHVP